MAAMTHAIADNPMLEINTTPLIDVMLVLLVMLIITIPLQSHSVKLDRPSGSVEIPDVYPEKSVVVVTRAGELLWNGRPIDRAQLRQLFAATLELPAQPELHLRPEPDAPHGPVDEVLVTAKRAGVTQLGFIGNEAYARF
jgi:biopolymer transport protein ExbD